MAENARNVKTLYLAIRMDNSARVLNRAGYIRQNLSLILAQESLLERIFFEMLVKT